VFMSSFTPSEPYGTADLASCCFFACCFDRRTINHAARASKITVTGTTTPAMIAVLFEPFSSDDEPSVSMGEGEELVVLSSVLWPEALCRPLHSTSVEPGQDVYVNKVHEII